MRPRPRFDRTNPSTRPVLGRFALGFVLAALFVLVLEPILVHREVDEARGSVEDIAGPAGTLVTRLQYSLSRQMSAIRGLLLTGDGAYLDSYSEALRSERQAYRDLEPLVVQLGTDAIARFSEVRTLSNQWHARIDGDSIVWRREASPQYLATIATEQELFEAILGTLSNLDLAIERTADRSRDRIRSIERFSFGLTALMGVLALFSAAIVGWLDIQVRRLAAEAEQRRLIAEEALEDSARATEARDRLIRGITHDVKNPLGAAAGYAQLLEMGVRGKLTAEQAELVSGMRRSVSGALAIITDLVELASADSTGISINVVHADLATIVADAVGDHQPAAEAAGLVIHRSTPDHAVEVQTDPIRVQQVLGNLLSNAIKYTPAPGTISVRLEDAERPGHAPRGSWVAIHVRDSGPGIPEDMRDAIFDEFIRLHDQWDVKGHGLGLAIARRIARLLGGDVTVENAEERGARFTLWLPRSHQGSDYG